MTALGNMDGKARLWKQIDASRALAERLCEWETLDLLERAGKIVMRQLRRRARAARVRKHGGEL